MRQSIHTRVPARILVPAIAAILAGTASTASAQGLEMCYEQVDLGGGLFEYTFSLTPDAGWVSGMGWGWLIFGDERSPSAGGTGVSPIDDFTMDPAQFPIGPWVRLQSTSGGHNGPTMGPVAEPWIPRDGSETLTWFGESTGRVAPGEMLFTTLAFNVGGALPANFQVATFECGSSCPCACNFDTSTKLGVCDLFDFLAFQDGFVAGDPCSCDIDTTTKLGVCDLFDFLAFQDAFVTGCP